MKEAILKRLHNIGLKLYCILEKAKYRGKFQNSWLLGFERIEKYWIHEVWRNFQVGDTILTDTLRVDIWHKVIKTHQNFKALLL